MNERQMTWHTLKSFSMNDLTGDPDKVIKKLTEDVVYYKSLHADKQLRFDSEYWMRGDDELPRLLLRVFEPQNDKEYNDQMVLEKERGMRARKQYEELKKRFEPK